jgi:hypothetical protein
MTGESANYFTATEDHFRAARGNPLFMLSPLDWALIEAWKNGGIPLAAVLRGIDTAFERWRRLPARARTRMVNSLAYCKNTIAEEAQAMASPAPTSRPEPQFKLDDIRAFIKNNATALRSAGYGDLAPSLEALDSDRVYGDLEHLEAHLTAIEGKLIARLLEAASEEFLGEIRRELESDLKPYRGKMTADQLAMLERQFLERRLLESARLPRLSLFYL